MTTWLEVLHGRLHLLTAKKTHPESQKITPNIPQSIHVTCHSIPFPMDRYNLLHIYMYIYILSICPNHSIFATSEASRKTSRPGKKRAEMQQTLKKTAKSSSLRYDHANGCQWMPLYAIGCKLGDFFWGGNWCGLYHQGTDWACFAEGVANRRFDL